MHETKPSSCDTSHAPALFLHTDIKLVISHATSGLITATGMIMNCPVSIRSLYLLRTAKIFSHIIQSGQCWDFKLIILRRHRLSTIITSLGELGVPINIVLSNRYSLHIPTHLQSQDTGVLLQQTDTANKMVVFWHASNTKTTHTCTLPFKIVIIHVMCYIHSYNFGYWSKKKDWCRFLSVFMCASKGIVIISSVFIEVQMDLVYLHAKQL